MNAIWIIPRFRNFFFTNGHAEHIRTQIREQLGFTVNIGISDRKVLAKMASDFKKPDLTHTLFSYEIQEKMWPLPVSSLFYAAAPASKRFTNWKS